ARDELRKSWFGDWIVEIGEGKILPDHQAEFVAELEEGWRLIGHGARNPQHVHLAGPRPLQPGPIVFFASWKTQDVRVGPDCAAAEHRDTVDNQTEALTVVAAVDGDAAEPGATQVDRALRSFDRYGVESRHAVSVRPPRFNFGQRECRFQPSVPSPVHHRLSTAAAQNGAVRCRRQLE